MKTKPGLFQFTTKRGVINEIDTTEVEHFIRLSITLDYLGNIASRWPNLQEAGFIKPDLQPHSTSNMSLSDLETIFEILPTTCEKLHYLSRRIQIEEHTLYEGDEIDLLAFYLDTGFNIGEAEFNGQGLMLNGMSKIFDPYFMQQWTSQTVSRPQPVRTKLWQDILLYIENMQEPGFSYLGYMLLNIAYQDQEAFEKRMQFLIENVQLNKANKDQPNSLLVVSGSSQKYTVITGLAYCQDQDAQQRKTLMEQATGQALDITQSSETLLVGINIDRPGYPCNVLGRFIKINQDN